MHKKDIETFYPTSRAEWRQWLKNNHSSLKSVWVIFCKKDSKLPTMSWSEAVDEALCFGWIDSTKKTIDKERYMQYFSIRKPNSTWSKINKEKIIKLTQSNLMTKAGFDCIETAKQNGSWIILDDVENLIVPEDLKKELESYPSSNAYFLSLSKSKKKEILAWIAFAKRTETREKRIKEVVECGNKNTRPKLFK